MKFKNKLIRTVSFVLTFLIIFSVFNCLPAMAINTQFSIAKGEYIQWGSLSGEPLIWVALEDSSNDPDSSNTVCVMSKDIVAMKPFNDEDKLPQNWGETSLFKWLNSKEGFWSVSNFPENDRYLRAVDYFSILSGTEFMEYFFDGTLSDVAAARYDGARKPWWIWGGSASEKKGYRVSKDGVLEEYYFEDISSDKAGVRPIATLNLESFYISSGTGTESNPYIISSVYNSDLKSLNITGCVLAPGFNTSVTEYTSTVTSNVDKITISAVPVDKNAGISIYLNDQRINITDSSTKNTMILKYGENVIAIRVLAVDGFSESVYTLKVTRKQNSSTEFLKKLQFFDNEPSFSESPEELKLSPQFSKDNLSYTIDVGRSVKKGKIVIEGMLNANAAIKLNNGNEIRLKQEKKTALSAVYSATFDINTDLALVTLTIATNDGKESKKYAVNVEHSDKALYVNNNVGTSVPEGSSPVEQSIDPNNTNEPDAPNAPDDQSGDTVGQSLPLYEAEEGIQWWIILLIALGGIIFVAGIIFAVVQLKNKNNDDELLDETPYYMGSASPLRQDLQKEREQAKEVDEFFEVIPRNSQYRGVYDNRPNMNKKDAFASNNNMADSANSQQRSDYSINMNGGFSQNSAQQNRTTQQSGFYGIYTPQQSVLAAQTDNAGQAVKEKTNISEDTLAVVQPRQIKSDPAKLVDSTANVPAQTVLQSVEIANAQPRLGQAHEEKQDFKLDFDADKEYRFNEYSNSSAQTDDIISNSKESENKVNDPVKTLEDKMRFDTEKDIFSSTAKPEDEFGGYM